MIVNFLQRCGLLTLQDTRTPPVLNAIYEQIVNRTVTYNNFIWRKSLSAEPKQVQTRNFTDVGATTRHLLENQHQYREQELLASLAQHKLELEEEKQHRLRTQRIYSAFAESKNSLRRQLEATRGREEELQTDLFIAEAERRKLKTLISILEASDVVLRTDLTAAEKGTREAEMMFEHQANLVTEKDHVIRSTTKDLVAVRAGLRDAEDKVVRLDAELQSERNLRVSKTKELLDEQVKARSRHEAEMRRIAKKAENVQEQMDLLDGMLSQSRARMQPLPDDGHTLRLKPYAIAMTPDDTGQPPPLPFESIGDVQTPRLDPITKYRYPLSPKSLRQTPERNPHDPTARHSSDHPHQISACLDRVFDSADSWRTGLDSLLETVHRLEEERAREAESREKSERCLQQELAATMEQLCATQEEVSDAHRELDRGQETLRELAATQEQLHTTQEQLYKTQEQLRATQEEVTNACRELDRERETLHDIKAHAGDVERELKSCQVKLKGAQEARRAGIVRFGEAVELLRLRSADLESLKAEAEASLSKCSQAISLSAVLRGRVTILEAEVKLFNRNQECAEMPPNHANSQSFSPADTDIISTAHSADIQTHDSSRSFLDSSLPPSPASNMLSSPNEEDPLHIIIGLDNVPLNLDPPQRPDFSSTCHLPLQFQSRILSPQSQTRRRSVVFLPGGSGVGSMDWPPIGSTLQLSGKNVEQDSGVNVRKTPQSPPQEADHTQPASSTPRDPSSHPLAPITNSRPLVFGDPGHFGVHGSASSRPAIEAPPSSASVSPSHPTFTGLTTPIRRFICILLGYEETPPAWRHGHGDAANISICSSPAQLPSPQRSGPAQLSQSMHTSLSLSHPLHAKSREDNLGTLERHDICDWNPSTNAHHGDVLTLVPRQTVMDDSGETRHEAVTAAAVHTCVSLQDDRLSVHRELLHPFGLNDAGGTLRITTLDLLGVRQSSQSASAGCAQPGCLPSSSRLQPEAVSGSDCPHSALSSHTPLGSPPPLYLQPYRASGEPMPDEDVDAHALECSSKSTPQSPLPRLLPGLLDPVLIREQALRREDSPCAFGKLKARRPNPHRANVRPYIPTLDYGLPGDFIPGTGCAATERPNQGPPEDDGFAYLIPFDCPTSTPVAISKRLAAKQRSPESETPWGEEEMVEHGMYPPDHIFDLLSM